MPPKPEEFTVSFFFQAEDGIRDLTVTGVQTCALPIFPAQPAGGSPSPRSARRRWSPPAAPPEAQSRSEERRVGKEGRPRWLPSHQKNNKKSQFNRDDRRVDAALVDAVNGRPDHASRKG